MHDLLQNIKLICLCIFFSTFVQCANVSLIKFSRVFVTFYYRKVNIETVTLAPISAIECQKADDENAKSNKNVWQLCLAVLKKQCLLCSNFCLLENFEFLSTYKRDWLLFAQKVHEKLFISKNVQFVHECKIYCAFLRFFSAEKISSTKKDFDFF